MRRSLLCFLAAAPLSRGAEVSVPAVLDPSLKIELIAAEPEINTPVGIAVDKKGRVFVIENNTHQVQPEYKGPPHDRIRVFEDTNADGKPDKVTTFAEGFKNAMCLQFDAAGALYFTKRDALLKLEDTNGDGVCDKQTTLLHWDTKGDYPHNGLSGIAFSPDGWIYVGSGENLSLPYTAIGADGRSITYQPGGANIFRIRPDGSGLGIMATGLWNGFGVECDGAGRLLAVDNDPDSSPPNRLLHIVPGGDYGFNISYGRSGIHPFQCWNGEIPGTLPMAGGVGEAAVAVMDLRRTAFRKPGLNVMVTSWGDNQIEAYQLTAKGASVTASERRVLVRGDASFRPAGMAAAPDGSVYVTDWADREYSVHGKGRIWRLSTKEPSKVTEAEATLPLPRVPQTLVAPTAASILADPDPFARAAGEAGLEQAAVLACLTHENPTVRVNAAALLRRAGSPAGPVPSWSPLTQEAVEKLLADPDPQVARVAMIIATGRRMKDLKPAVENALRKHGADREVFRTGIAALDLIDRDAGARPLDSNDRLLLKFIMDPAQPPAVRALAMLSLGNRVAMVKKLTEVLKDKEPAVAAAAARTLGAVPQPVVVPPLRDLALDNDAPLPARLDAIAALAGRPDTELLPLLPLLRGEPGISRQAVRTLRWAIARPEVKTALEQAFAGTKDHDTKAMLAIALGLPPVEIRPGTDEQWREAVRTGKGNPDEGRRVFFSNAALCSTCHKAEGRGTTVGPDLNTIARSPDEEKLLSSILTPSREIGPLYVMKSVTLKDGRVISGVQSDKETGGRVDLLQPGGEVLKAEKHEVQKIDIAPVSLMPEGLELNLTVQEFRDLIAYLKTLK